MANIYKRFSPDDIVPLKKKRTQSVFTGNNSTLDTFFTGSQATETEAGGRALYHLNVFDKDPIVSSSAAIQFSLSYGHISGFGTPSVSTDSNSTRATQAIYKQYANTLLPKLQQKFKFDGSESDDIFVLNFSRARIRESIDPGSFEIELNGSGGSVTLTDDFSNTTNLPVTPGGIVLNLKDSGGNLSSGGHRYGEIYPESGVVIFNASALNNKIGISRSAGNTSANTYDNNHFELYDALVSIKAVSAENLSSENYFVRVRNKEFNFSNNPTFVTGSEKQIIDDLFNEPVTYITSIGLYNDNNELLAIAKLSKPTQNTRDTETLVKIKLDF